MNQSIPMRLYVSNLPWDIQEDDITSIFKSMGEIHGLYMMNDDQGRFKGTAFVTVTNAFAAISALNGIEICGRVITVRPAIMSKGRADRRSQVPSLPEKDFSDKVEPNFNTFENCHKKRAESGYVFRKKPAKEDYPGHRENRWGTRIQDRKGKH